MGLTFADLPQNDFRVVEGFRSERFAHRALGLRAVPSSATLRQRFDAMGTEQSELADQISRALLSLRINGAAIDFGALNTGHLRLEIDTFVMDQSDTANEGVSWTYAGVEGYCPIALYLGTRGYCLELDLRAGSQHSATESEFNMERALSTACGVTPAPLLLRADSGFCSQHLIERSLAQAARLNRKVDMLIKWNPRTAPVEKIAAQRCADTGTVWTQLREGKRECLWNGALRPVELEGASQRALRRVYRLTERTLDKRGQPMLFEVPIEFRLPTGRSYAAMEC